MKLFTMTIINKNPIYFSNIESVESSLQLTNETLNDNFTITKGDNRTWTIVKNNVKFGKIVELNIPDELILDRPVVLDIW